MGGTQSKNAESQATDLINTSLKENNIVVFSKLTCGYCQAVKDTLSQQSGKLARSGCVVPTPKFIELDDGSIPREISLAIQKKLGEQTGAITVPRVFVDGGFIGGAQETVQMAQNGQLKLILMRSGKCLSK